MPLSPKQGSIAPEGSLASSNVADESRPLSRGPRVLQFGCMAVAAALCVPALQNLPLIWSKTHYLGHGYLIPLVSLFLLYSNRQKISRALASAVPPSTGALVAFLTTALMVLAVIGDVGFVAGLLVPALLMSSLYAVGGLSLLRPTLVPIGFLALMVPPPGFLTTDLLFRLKLLVTDVAVWLLQASGRTLATQGNQILLPEHSLFVADACSGLTSIITLIPLGCVVAYFLCSGIWRRLVVVASIIPLALAANILRVYLTVALVSHFGIEFAEGLLHESFGMTTYVAGTVALVLIAKLVER